jgi:photosystem II stability/assembly factor-like uncharacterized protein
VAGPPPLPPDSFDLDVYLPGFDRVTWVDARTGIASGYVGRGKSSVRNAVLRTSDGGMHWDTVSFGGDQWVYDAFVDRGGGVWMGGSSGVLVFSGDSGRTWRTVSSPFDGSTRLHAIWIDDGRTGVAAALIGNALKLTRDGGRTWQALATPLDQRKHRPGGEESSDRIEAAALLEGRLWVAQDGHLFTSPLAEVRWAEVGPGDPLWTFTVDRASGTVYALGESRHVYEVGADGSPRRLTDKPVHARAGNLSARAGVVYAIDEEGTLYRISRGRMVESRPRTRAGVRPAVRLVAAAAGVTWGASDHALYTSAGAGHPWRLVGTSPQAIAGMLGLGDGRLMLWSRHGFNAVFDPRAGTLEEIAELRGDDVVEVLAGDSLWVAFGGGQRESAGRVDVGRTFYSGEFAGSRPNGFVYVSRDRGRSWTRVDEWPGHGVAGVFVHPGGALTLLSYLGSVRRLTPTTAGYRPATLLTATPRNHDAVPYVQELGGMYFAGNEGWVDGWIHHLGNRRYVTHDGGRSWTQARVRSNHYVEMFPVSGGWVGFTGYRLFRIGRGGERMIFAVGGREPRYDPEGVVPPIFDAAPGPGGSVTVLLRSGEARRVELPR